MTSFPLRFIQSVFYGLGLVGSIVAVVFYEPVAVFYSSLVILFYAFVLTCLASVALKGYADAAFENSPKPRAERTMFLLSPILPLFAFLSFANAYFDQSPIEVHEDFIQDKSWHSTKQGRRFNVSVAPPVQMQGPFTESTHLRVSRETYDHVQLGVSKAQIQMRHGWLKIPWVQSYKILLGDSPHVAQDWVAEPVIEIPGAALRKENWPSGAPKSAEPIVDGQIQGTAHYWHANGKLYADIPYKNGKKHGRFKLFRENGALEQDLSYKDGVPHGILRWYDDLGNQVRQLTYIDGQPQRE